MRVHWTTTLSSIWSTSTNTLPSTLPPMPHGWWIESPAVQSRSPISGRKVPEYEAEDIRELIEKPYRIIYRIKSDQIDVLAVIHGARLLPEEI